jgi:hypothetical protein
MAQIPTAKSFYQNYIEENNHDSHVDIEEMLIEFAKLHVEQALKEASEKGEIGDGDFISDGHYEKFIDKESILNSYPLTNIK